ncbi:ribonuclease H-like domain-containing protein, partial [Tanacetum coccineum]
VMILPMTLRLLASGDDSTHECEASGLGSCYACCDSLLLTPLYYDDIHEVTPRVSALAGCDNTTTQVADDSSSEGNVPSIENVFPNQANHTVCIRQDVQPIKKTATISRSSAEAEYRCMASATCELVWVSNILQSLKVTNLFPIDLYSDSISAIQIAANPVFHKKTKYFEIDVHVVKEKVQSGVIKTEKIAFR